MGLQEALSFVKEQIESLKNAGAGKGMNGPSAKRKVKKQLADALKSKAELEEKIKKNK